MREVQVCPPVKQRPLEVAVRRLQFAATGEKLVAWVGTVSKEPSERSGRTDALWVHNIASGSSEMLSDVYWNLDELTPSDAEPAVTPDLRLIATERLATMDELDAMVFFTDTANLDEHLPELHSIAGSSGGLLFTADGTELLVVRNLVANTARWPELSRCGVHVLTEPPRRYRQGMNPFTGGTIRVPVRSIKWEPILNFEHGEMATAFAVSADGRWVAIGRADGTIDVGNVKVKQIHGTFPWDGGAVADRVVGRVEFAPASEWLVVILANGRLFAKPLGKGKWWQTEDTLGYVRDFTFHPSGHMLCAVFADGQARYLDPLTGAVKQSFRWSKKPKPLYSVAFAPDGLTCAAGGENGRVVIWDVDF